MLRSYLKIAARNLMKHKVFSFINVFGLTIGLTSFILIALYVFDELTFDRFHKNQTRIYRLVETIVNAEGKELRVASVGYQVSDRSKSNLPEVEAVVRIAPLGRANVTTLENKNAFYEDFWIANPSFLTVFDFPLLNGDRRTALTAPNSVIVTEETARKLFGTADVIGKSIQTDRDSLPFKITAVLKNFPTNSHISFNLCYSESSIRNQEFVDFINRDWISNAFPTYILLNGNTNTAEAESKLNRLVIANIPKDAGKRSYELQPLAKVHFYSTGIEGGLGSNGNITYIYVFSVVALFVLLIACINYMNLTTARFSNRAKEIAVRKVAGASRESLTAQFLSEAFLMSGIALIFSIILAKSLLPAFNSFTEKELTIEASSDYRIWVGLAATMLLVGFTSGIYPALFQSGMKPLALLKSKISIGKGSLSLRRSLVVVQFSLSIIMIIATIVVYRQMQYVNRMDMGFDKEQLLVVDINSGKVRRSAETIKTEFARIPQVTNVTVTSRVPGEWKNIPRIGVERQSGPRMEKADMYFIGADEKFVETFKISVLRGRNFSQGSGADSSSVMINETAAKMLGISEPAGQVIHVPQESYTAAVIGIVKDFNFQSLREPVSPMVIGYRNNPVHNIDYFTARLSTSNVAETIKQMEAVIHSIDQDHLFEYHFLDKQWNLFYREDKIRETIFLILALLTIAIACLGLFGLATYAAEQRIREIGIRKVLGASVTSIVSMLSRDFLKLVVIASVVAFPVAWWIMHNWLQEFAFHTTIRWWIFVIAGGTALLIAMTTISFQAIRAAIANPIRSLRTE